ncbi:methylated-DNA--[bacterium]|nr:methylated-DNA--[protein]-cysteine S-methyltransferase [bacterium]
MTFTKIYRTPNGFDDMVMSSDGEVLTGLRFINKQDQSKQTMDREEKDLSVFSDTKKWLDIYFSGRQPDFIPAYRIDRFTPFRKKVSDIMQSIPFGHTMTYGEIAALIAQKRGIKRMSAQAVGGAVGWNPLCIIIPCHRVIGVNKSLTGYGGGIKNKIALLKLEGIEFRKP